MKKTLATIILAFCLFSPAHSFYKRNGDRVVEPFDRGIESPNSLFIPKGTIGSGVTFSYNVYDAGKSENDAGFALLSSLLKDIKGSYKSVSVSPAVVYFFKDNVSVGIRFDYSKVGLELAKASLSLSESLKLGISDFGYERQSYLGSVTIRNYMPIQQSKRFALFMEGRLTGGYAQSKNFTVEEGLKHGTYQDIYKGSLNLVPGICAFVANAVSFEVQIGMMGINYQMVKQVRNQVERSQLSSSGANFNINLFSISLGMSFYIMDKFHRIPKIKKTK